MLMDEAYNPVDRAARRREQNRIAQRNHRRRKQLKQAPSQQTQQQAQQQQHDEEPQQVWPPDWRMNQDDNDENGLSFSFEKQSWDENPTPAALAKQGRGMNNNNNIGGLQTELLDLFDSIVQEPPSDSCWDPEQIYPSPSTDDESLRGVSGAVSRNLQPDEVDLERRTPNGSGRDLSSRRERLSLPNSSSPFTSSLHPSAPPRSMTESRSRTQLVVAKQSSHPTPGSLARGSARDSRPQQTSPPTSVDQVCQEELAQSSLSPGNRARTSSFPQQQHRRPREPKDYPARTACGESYGQTCLHLASAAGSCALVRYFLDRGMRPEKRDGEGLPALHHAIRGGHEDTVNVLLLGGADIEATDSRGRTALHFAVEERQDDIVAQLLRKGANMLATVTPPIRRGSR